MTNRQLPIPIETYGTGKFVLDLYVKLNLGNSVAMRILNSMSESQQSLLKILMEQYNIPPCYGVNV